MQIIQEILFSEDLWWVMYHSSWGCC